MFCHYTYQEKNVVQVKNRRHTSIQNAGFSILNLKAHRIIIPTLKLHRLTIRLSMFHEDVTKP